MAKNCVAVVKWAGGLVVAGVFSALVGATLVGFGVGSAFGGSTLRRQVAGGSASPSSLAVHPSVFPIQEYVEESERDYPLRLMKPLQITQVKGDVSVQGWAFDKVRIKIRKKVLTDSPIKAKKMFTWLDYRYDPTQRNLEIASQYGSGLSIEERVREKDKPQVKLEITVLAPSHLNLQIWVVDGRVTLKNWLGPAEVRSNSGSVRVENFKGNLISVVCASCSAQFRQIRGSLRSMTGSGAVDLSQVQGDSIYVETEEGALRMSEVSGNQLYTSKRGSMEGQFLSGKVEFQGGESRLNFREIKGFLSGSLESGEIRAQVRDWKFLDQGIIETQSGDIHLGLPRRFSADLDVWSKAGNVEVNFPIMPGKDVDSIGPQPLGRLMGRAREGGSLLRVYSESGNIHLNHEDF